MSPVRLRGAAGTRRRVSASGQTTYVCKALFNPKKAPIREQLDTVDPAKGANPFGLAAVMGSLPMPAFAKPSSSLGSLSFLLVASSGGLSDLEGNSDQPRVSIPRSLEISHAAHHSNEKHISPTLREAGERRNPQ